MTFKLKINLLVLLILTSCVEKQQQTQLDFSPTGANSGSSGSAGGSSGGAGVPSGTAEMDKNIALKTFNQYNMSLSKITGIDPTNATVSTEYGLIKNSLPGEHSASNFTPFNQIAMIRLSGAYCDVFINIDNEFASKNLDYATVTAQVMTTKLLLRFFGAKNAANAVLYDKYNAEILKIMNNDAGVDEQGAAIGKLVPVTTGAALNQNLSKLACSAILSSAEFTTL